MIRRVERAPSTPQRLGIMRRRQRLEAVENHEVPELALRYSNGFVTVEVSRDAVDSFVEAFGDVPLPVHVDAETGDRSTFDARRWVRVIYDREARLREVTTRGQGGLYIRLTVMPDAAPAQPAGGKARRGLGGSTAAATRG
jgi:hypothetical protein